MKKASVCTPTEFPGDFITPREFCRAWRQEWNNLSNKEDFVEKYQSTVSTPWTEYMLTSDCAFLKRVAKELGFKAERQENVRKIEYDRFDMALLSDLKDGYPTMLDVLIEHENDYSKIKNEMWKLMLRRSPLKVIVSYCHEPESKLKECWEMLDEANENFGENSQTTYLFIIGNLVGKDKPYKIRWRWSSDKRRSLQDLC